MVGSSLSTSEMLAAYGGDVGTGPAGSTSSPDRPDIRRSPPVRSRRHRVEIAGPAPTCAGEGPRTDTDERTSHEVPAADLQQPRDLGAPRLPAYQGGRCHDAGRAPTDERPVR